MPDDRDSDLVRTLEHLADLLAVTSSPWWIISGAAAALHGETSLALSDVDVLLDRADALAVADAIGAEVSPGSASDLFRSDVFFRWSKPPLPVEFMAGFEVGTEGGWQSVAPVTRRALSVGGRVTYVPDVDELIAMFRLFGRPRDLARAEGLKSLHQSH